MEGAGVGATVFGGFTGGRMEGAGVGTPVFGGLTGVFAIGAGFVGTFGAGGFTLGAGSTPTLGVTGVPGVLGVPGVVSGVPLFGVSGGRVIPSPGAVLRFGVGVPGVFGSTFPRAVALGDGGETAGPLGLARPAVFGAVDFGANPLLGLVGREATSSFAERGVLSLAPVPLPGRAASSVSVLARRSPTARTLRAASNSDWRSAAETVCKFRRPSRPASFNEVNIVTLFKFVLLTVVLLFVMLLMTVFC